MSQHRTLNRVLWMPLAFIIMISLLCIACITNTHAVTAPTSPYQKSQQTLQSCSRPEAKQVATALSEALKTQTKPCSNQNQASTFSQTLTTLEQNIKPIRDLAYATIFAKELNERKLRQALFAKWRIDASFGFTPDLKSICPLFKKDASLVFDSYWNCNNSAFKTQLQGYLNEFQKLPGRASPIYDAKTTVPQINSAIQAFNKSCQTENWQLAKTVDYFAQMKQAQFNTEQDWRRPAPSEKDSFKSYDDAFQDKVTKESFIQDIESADVQVEHYFSQLYQSPAGKLLLSPSIIREMGLSQVFTAQNPNTALPTLVKALASKCLPPSQGLKPLTYSSQTQIKVYQELQAKLVGNGTYLDQSRLDLETTGELQHIIWSQEQLSKPLGYESPRNLITQTLDDNPIVFADLIAAHPEMANAYAQTTCEYAHLLNINNKMKTAKRMAVNIAFAGAGIAACFIPGGALVSLTVGTAIGLTSAGYNAVESQKEKQSSLQKSLSNDLVALDARMYASPDLVLYEQTSEESKTLQKSSEELKSASKTDLVLTLGGLGLYGLGKTYSSIKNLKTIESTVEKGTLTGNKLNAEIKAVENEVKNEVKGNIMTIEPNSQITKPSTLLTKSSASTGIELTPEIKLAQSEVETLQTKLLNAKKDNLSSKQILELKKQQSAVIQDINHQIEDNLILKGIELENHNPSVFIDHYLQDPLHLNPAQKQDLLQQLNPFFSKRKPPTLDEYNQILKKLTQNSSQTPLTSAEIKNHYEQLRLKFSQWDRQIHFLTENSLPGQIKRYNTRYIIDTDYLIKNPGTQGYFTTKTNAISTSLTSGQLPKVTSTQIHENIHLKVTHAESNWKSSIHSSNKDVKISSLASTGYQDGLRVDEALTFSSDVFQSTEAITKEFKSTLTSTLKSQFTPEQITLIEQRLNKATLENEDELWDLASTIIEDHHFNETQSKTLLNSLSNSNVSKKLTETLKQEIASLDPILETLQDNFLKTQNQIDQLSPRTLANIKGKSNFALDIDRLQAPGLKYEMHLTSQQTLQFKQLSTSESQKAFLKDIIENQLNYCRTQSESLERIKLLSEYRTLNYFDIKQLESLSRNMIQEVNLQLHPSKLKIP